MKVENYESQTLVSRFLVSGSVLYLNCSASRPHTQGKCHACAAAAASAPERRGSGPHDPGKTGTPPHQLQNRSDGGGGGIKSTSAVMSGGVDGRSGAERVGEAEVIARSDAHAAGEALSVVRPTDTSILGDPQSAFGYFRERHPSRTALEENKSLLSEKYTRAKVREEGGTRNARDICAFRILMKRLVPA